MSAAVIFPTPPPIPAQSVHKPQTFGRSSLRWVGLAASLAVVIVLAGVFDLPMRWTAEYHTPRRPAKNRYFGRWQHPGVER